MFSFFDVRANVGNTAFMESVNDRIDALTYRTTRGGARQRAAAQAELDELTQHLQCSSPPPRFKSEFVQSIIRKWCWGFRSAIEVQSEIQLQLHDQYRLLDKFSLGHDNVDDELVKFAALGSAGVHRGNCHRELLRFLGDPTYVARDSFPLTIKDVKPNRWLTKYVVCDQAIIYPHKLFAYMYKNDHHKFIQQFVDHDGSHDPSCLWNAALERGDPRLRDSPVLERPNHAIRIFHLCFCFYKCMV